MVVFMVFVLMFAQVFYILLGPDAPEDGDGDVYDDDAEPFHSGFESVISVGLMSTGVFERSWFLDNDDATRSHVLEFYFVVFLFVVFIIMLNVLIAVVSDSYDFASTQAQSLFLVTRLGLVAELDALGLTQSGLVPPHLEECLAALVRPLARSLRLIKETSDDDDDADDDDGEESETYEGRIKYMESQIRGIVQHEFQIRDKTQREYHTDLLGAIRRTGIGGLGFSRALS